MPHIPTIIIQNIKIFKIIRLIFSKDRNVEKEVNKVHTFNQYKDGLESCEGEKDVHNDVATPRNLSEALAKEAEENP